jgi:GMP synthase (glutamine-hydrolysing)
MPILVFRHVPFEHLGLIAPVLDAKGLPWKYVDLFRDPDIPIALETATGVISMGGPMSANDDLPYIRRELGLLQQAIAAAKPVLGICLGAQLISKALDAKIYKNPAKEIGWAPVYWTDAARHDTLFRGLNEPETVLHWHGETFDIPAGGERLAWSDLCANQAFCVSSRVYGLQFHLEVAPEMIAQWCLEDANAGDVRELTASIDPHFNAPRLAEIAKIIFGRWADLVS